MTPPLSVKIGRVLGLSLAVLVIAGTALPLLKSKVWWIRAFDFPRLQLLILGVVILVIVPFLGWIQAPPKWFPHWTVAVLLLAAVFYQGWRIYPYTPLAPYESLPPQEGVPAPAFTLMVANVYMYNEERGPLLALVQERRPDLLLLVEPDTPWLEDMAPIHETCPYRILQPQDNTYGLALYSRWPLIDGRVGELLEGGIPSIHTGIRLHGGGFFQFHGIHPRPPAPQHAEDSLERDAELYLVGKRVQEHGQPAIVTGDLNDVAWS